jgi:hypothetical protein
VDRYGLPRERAEEDLDRFLDQVRSHRLLEPSTGNGVE